MSPDAAGHVADHRTRVLLLVATRRDAEVTQRLLTGRGLESTVCGSLAELAAEIEDGAGALLLTEEALASEEAGRLVAVLRRQEEWSDLPIVVLMKRGSDSTRVSSVLRRLTNVTVLERPAPIRSVLSAVETAVRARHRQYEIRDHLEAVQRAEAQAQYARVEAERANRLKDEFLATLSHELRTPLNAISGWVELLKDDPEDVTTVKEAAAAMARNVRMQAELIEDLLDVSRIISGKARLELRAVQLAEIVAASLETVRPMAQAKGVRLESHVEADLPALTGDPPRLQQVVWNLLSNAIKFTPAGGRVSVKLRREAASLLITVTDTGEGIAAEFLPRLFERFSQADSSPGRRHGGLGLGLSIVKSLMEMHGGRVWATSPGPGRGSTFHVELPLTAAVSVAGPAPGPPAPATPDAAPPALQGLRVLVVDDEPDAREVLRRLLARGGANPLVAGSAEEAQALIESEQPKVIVSDIGMPGTDGYRFVRELRAKSIDTPAIALTAFARFDDADRAYDAGYQSHLPKPVEAAKLLAEIARLAGLEAQ